MRRITQTLIFSAVFQSEWKSEARKQNSANILKIWIKKIIQKFLEFYSI